MQTILPSGPERDNRTQLSPVEAMVEYAKRHPRTTALIVGAATAGIGVIPAVVGTQIGLWVSKDFRMMKQTAKAHYYDRQANRMSAAGNTRRATEANQNASKIRQKLARM